MYRKPASGFVRAISGVMLTGCTVIPLLGRRLHRSQFEQIRQIDKSAGQMSRSWKPMPAQAGVAGDQVRRSLHSSSDAVFASMFTFDVKH